MSHAAPDLNDDHDNVYDACSARAHLASGRSAPASRTRCPESTPTVPAGVDPADARGVLPHARRRRAGLAQRLSRVGQQRAGPRGRHRAGQHRPRPARPGPAAAGARGRRRPVGRPDAPRAAPVPAEDALAFFREARLPQRPAGRDRRTATSPRPSPGCCCSRRVRLAASSGCCASRPGAGRDRGQGRQGADLPPRLRRPVVRPAGRRHRRVAAPAAGRAALSGRTWSAHDAGAGCAPASPRPPRPRSTSSSTRCFAVERRRPARAWRPTGRPAAAHRGAVPACSPRCRPRPRAPGGHW